jgi:Flp pilus assembly protein TadD
MGLTGILGDEMKDGLPARPLGRQSPLIALTLLALLAGCATRGGMDASTMGWIQVETEDLIFRTDVDRKDAVELVKEYQRLRTAIAENELPCAFERSNAPMEFVLLKEQQRIDDLAGRRYIGGITAWPPSSRLDSKLQLVMSRREASNNTQLFVHELTHAGIAMCFPTAPPWVHEGMASFYETARIRNGELVLGMPAYGFVTMTDVEPMFDIYPVVANMTVVWMLPTRLAPDFDELRRMDEEAFFFLGKRRSVSDMRETTAHYAGSWHAIHLLQFGDSTLSERFSRYLGALARGEEDREAWSKAFAGVDVASRYQQYLGTEYKMGSRPIDLVEPREPIVRSMSEVEVALLWARLHGWSSKEDAQKARQYMQLAHDRDPESPDAMLHLAAYHSDLGEDEEGRRWLERALDAAPEDPQVLATLMLWHAGREDLDEETRAELEGWAEALSRSAQTGFQLTELGEYTLREAGDAKAALQQLHDALVLDATWWLTYALAGEALEQLGREEEAIRSYYTAIALTAHEDSDLRNALKRKIARLKSLSEPSSEAAVSR